MRCGQQAFLEGTVKIPLFWELAIRNIANFEPCLFPIKESILKTFELSRGCSQIYPASTEQQGPRFR